MQPWVAGLERALKRLQGQWMWELLLVPWVWWKQWPNQRRLMSDPFTEVISIYYSSGRVSYEQQVFKGRTRYVISRCEWLVILELVIQVTTDYTTDLRPVFTCVCLHSTTVTLLWACVCVCICKAVVALLLFWYQHTGPPLTFNYRELQLICAAQGVKLTQKAFHCINVKYVQICKQIKQIHGASVSLTQSSNFKAIVINVMVFSTIVRTPNIKHLQKEGVYLIIKSQKY